MSSAQFKVETLPAVMTGIAGLASLTLILAFQDQLPFSRTSAKTAGFLVLYAGMALMVWAAMHIKQAIRGLVSPRLERLVVTGPYRLVRHPVYLGATVAMIGACIIASSLLGLLGVMFVFVPVELHRARLEEKALSETFGEAWGDYSSRVGFFLPTIRWR